jgi:dCMP deaminase
MKERKFVEYYMGIAESTAKLSYAKRLQVGCIVVRENRILSIGYNGMPAGWDNVCEDEEGFTKPEVLHAETNAITKLSSSTESSAGSVVFVTHAPCIHCAKLIYQSNVYVVIYKYPYRDTAGIAFLEKSNVDVCMYDDLIKLIGEEYGQ